MLWPGESHGVIKKKLFLIFVLDPKIDRPTKTNTLKMWVLMVIFYMNRSLIIGYIL